MTQGNIYMDFNATTPVAVEVRDRVPGWLEDWGNPSSIHAHGRGAKQVLREARRSIAQQLSCHPLEIIFTQGGSEANNLAIKGSLLKIKKQNSKKSKVILGSIEHPSVLKQKQFIEELGFDVVLIPVSLDGDYDLDFYQSQLNEDVALVSVMYANNEVGIIAPLKQMVEMAHQVGAVFHSDMVQALGKIPFSLQDLNVDLASFSSHKVYALKGAGILFCRKGNSFESLIDGGSQERGRRAGTENLLAIAAFAQQVANIDSEAFQQRVSQLRDQLEAQLKKQIPAFKVLAEQAPRLANTSCFYIEDLNAETLLMNLDIKGFSVGTGAACSSGNPEPSPVLLALGLTREQAQASLRISLGTSTTAEHVDQFCVCLVEIVQHLRKLTEDSEVACV